MTRRRDDVEDRLEPGPAYIAPGGLQTLLRRDGSQLSLELSPGQTDARYKPCIDTTFRSAASACGAGVLAIVLTGMGDDGCRGGQILKDRGAQVWAQDEASSVVYGMPRAVIEAGLADAVVSSTAIAPKLMAAL